jgi:hypothetical protein
VKPLAHHDLVAELAGFRNELAHSVSRGLTKRAAAVRAEIARVTGEIHAEITALRARGEAHMAAGQDGLAAQVAGRVRALVAAAGDPDGPAPARLLETTDRSQAPKRTARQGG